MSSLQNPMQAFDGLPIRQAVFRQIFPAVASQMITLIYNLADTYFVGLLNQPSQTAAITVVYSPFLMLTAISNLFGVGGASALARALGHKVPDKAREIAAISFWWGAGASLVFCALFWVFAAPILSLCGATADTLPIALGYAKWAVVIGGPATILNTLLANLIRAEGKAGQASFGVSMGGIANLVLDPLFILPQFLGLGAVGAGIATCLSNVLSVVYFLLCLVRQRNESVIGLHPRHLRHSRKYLGNILAIGFPSALQYALTVVAVAAQSRFVSPVHHRGCGRPGHCEEAGPAPPLLFHRRVQRPAPPAGLPLRRRAAGEAPGRLPPGGGDLPALCPGLPGAL